MAFEARVKAPTYPDADHSAAAPSVRLRSAKPFAASRNACHQARTVRSVGRETFSMASVYPRGGRSTPSPMRAAGRSLEGPLLGGQRFRFRRLVRSGRVALAAASGPGIRKQLVAGVDDRVLDHGRGRVGELREASEAGRHSLAAFDDRLDDQVGRLL